MTMQMTNVTASARRPLRSVLAVLAGFIAVFVLSIATDQVFHSLQVYPPWGEPMHDTGLLVLALGYRCVYTVAGGYIAARLAPSAPMNHSVALGIIGIVTGTAGAIAMWDFGPNWFPVAIVLSALPCVWLGGVLHRQWHG
jgi:hypothetical protein